MEFAWSDEQQALYRHALDAGRRLPRAADAPLRARWQHCAEFGLMGLSLPAAHGGIGLDALTTAYVLEAFGVACDDAGLLFAAAAHLFACAMPIAEAGDDDARRRWLPGLAAGQLIGANAITEAGAGSDVFALATRAARDGDDYVLHGSKSYVTNAPIADVFVVYAATHPARGPLGVTAFVVPRDTPGLQIGAAFATTGLRSASIAPIYLDACRLPAARRLGPEGGGAAIFLRSMAWERACLFALYLGAMERQLADTLAHAGHRVQGKSPIGRYQAVAHRIADMKLRLEAARLLVYRACWLHDRGRDATLEIALAKLAVSEAAVASALDAVRVHGGLGVIADTAIGHAVADAVPATIFSGTSDIQRNLIASRLGL